MTAAGNTIPSLDDAALREFIRDMIADKIFTCHHIRETNLLGSIFIPITFGAFADWTEAEVEEIGAVWEHRSQAGPRAINGYPMFFSCRLINKADWEKALKIMKREKARLKELSLDLDEE